MEQLQYLSIQEKMEEFALKNEQLTKENRKYKKTIKHLKRVIRNYKDAAEKQRQRGTIKQHYRNGQKRGSNGRHG